MFLSLTGRTVHSAPPGSAAVTSPLPVPCHRALRRGGQGRSRDVDCRPLHGAHVCLVLRFSRSGFPPPSACRSLVWAARFGVFQEDAPSTPLLKQPAPPVSPVPWPWLWPLWPLPLSSRQPHLHGFGAGQREGEASEADRVLLPEQRMQARRGRVWSVGVRFD